MTQHDTLSAALERHRRALEASYDRQLQLQRERLAQLTTELETAQQATRDIAERGGVRRIALEDADYEAIAATARQWAEVIVRETQHLRVDNPAQYAIELRSVLSTRPASMLMRVHNYWYGGRCNLRTIGDMNQMFATYGLEAWEHFLNMPQVGEKTVAKVLDLLMRRRDLSDEIIASFEELVRLEYQL